jgi:hypothetical protein
MTGDFEPIEVMRGPYGPFTGVRLGRVAAYEFPLLERDQVRPGLPKQDRAYLLLDEGIQLSCPPGFPPEQAGWWYVDLVKIVEDGSNLTVIDHFVDVIVGPPGHYYRLLDLDELGDAIESGERGLTVAEAVAGLRNFQRFLDRYLNRRHDITFGWPDFPPRAIRPLTVEVRSVSGGRTRHLLGLTLPRPPC